jgi:uncharacterized protein (TIGR02271 family)
VNQRAVFPAQPIERVREGLPVVDSSGEKVGTVARVKLGDPQAVTAQGNEPDESGVLGIIPIGVGRQPEPDVPEPLRSQLLRVGFVKVDGRGLSDAERYVPADRILEVTEEAVRLKPKPSAAPAGGQPARAAAATAPPARQKSARPGQGIMTRANRGTLAAIVGALATVWLYRRRRRDRDRPIDRLRRQVRDLAAEAAWPAGGLGGALALLLLLTRRLRAGDGQHAQPTRAADSPRDDRDAGPSITAQEGRRRAAQTELPTRGRSSVRRMAPGRPLAATPTRPSWLPPSGGTGLGLATLLALGGVGYLVWRTFRGGGRAPQSVRPEGGPGRGWAASTQRVARPIRRVSPAGLRPVQPSGSSQVVSTRTAGHEDLDVGRVRTSGEEPALAGWQSVVPRLRARWEQSSGARAERWEEAEPSYRYGWEMSHNPRHRGRAWTELEPELRAGWERRHPQTPWGRAAGAVRDAWESESGRTRHDPAAGHTVELREEKLRPRTEPVRSGQVEIRKEVVVEEQTVEVPITREEVSIEHRPVEPRPADRPIDEGETIRVPVHGEQITDVKKQPVVTGEITVRKRPAEHTEQVSDTVRREEARIEPEGDVHVDSDEPGRQR